MQFTDEQIKKKHDEFEKTRAGVMFAKNGLHKSTNRDLKKFRNLGIITDGDFREEMRNRKES